MGNNEYIVSLIAQKRTELLPFVFKALYDNSRSHWNSTVHGLTCNVVKLFMEMDPKLFDICSQRHEENLKSEAEGLARSCAKWAELEKRAEGHKHYTQAALQEKKASLLYATRLQQTKDHARNNDFN